MSTPTKLEQVRENIKRMWKLRFEHCWCSQYTGIGYRLGKGFDVEVKKFTITWRSKVLFRVLTDFKIRVEHEEK